MRLLYLILMIKKEKDRFIESQIPNLIAILFPSGCSKRSRLSSVGALDVRYCKYYIKKYVKDAQSFKTTKR
jgi:hypothetical protein